MEFVLWVLIHSFVIASIVSGSGGDASGTGGDAGGVAGSSWEYGVVMLMMVVIALIEETDDGGDSYGNHCVD